MSTRPYGVVVCRPTFADLLDLAVDQPRRYGSGEPEIVERLFQLLREVACGVHTPEYRRVIRVELGRVRTAVQHERTDEIQRQRYDELYAELDQELTGPTAQ